MAGSLKGQTFYHYQNNGVVALVAQVDWEDYLDQHEREREVCGALKNPHATEHMSNPPIFTFVRLERFAGRPWYTAPTEFLERVLLKYIAAEGGVVEERGIFVPFSNGHEGGGHGERSQQQELAG